MNLDCKEPVSNDANSYASCLSYLEHTHAIHKDTVFTIGQFSILWCWFEQDLFDSNLTSSKLKNWAGNYFRANESNEHLKHLCVSVCEKSKFYLGEVDDTLVRNRIYSTTNQGSSESRNTINAFLEGNFSTDYFIGCILYIGRIRNNLFHGLKGLHTLDEQKEMFNSINELLLYILQHQKIPLH